MFRPVESKDTKGIAPLSDADQEAERQKLREAIAKNQQEAQALAKRIAELHKEKDRLFFEGVKLHAELKKLVERPDPEISERLTQYFPTYWRNVFNKEVAIFECISNPENQTLQINYKLDSDTQSKFKDFIKKVDSNAKFDHSHNPYDMTETAFIKLEKRDDLFRQLAPKAAP